MIFSLRKSSFLLPSFSPSIPSSFFLFLSFLCHITLPSIFHPSIVCLSVYHLSDCVCLFTYLATYPSINLVSSIFYLSTIDQSIVFASSAKAVKQQMFVWLTLWKIGHVGKSFSTFKISVLQASIFHSLSNLSAEPVSLPLWWISSLGFIVVGGHPSAKLSTVPHHLSLWWDKWDGLLADRRRQSFLSLCGLSVVCEGSSLEAYELNSKVSRMGKSKESLE